MTAGLMMKNGSQEELVSIANLFLAEQSDKTLPMCKLMTYSCKYRWH